MPESNHQSNSSSSSSRTSKESIFTDAFERLARLDTDVMWAKCHIMTDFATKLLDFIAIQDVSQTLSRLKEKFGSTDLVTLLLRIALNPEDTIQESSFGPKHSSIFHTASAMLYKF